jgi:hypothetical protein
MGGVPELHMDSDFEEQPADFVGLERSLREVGLDPLKNLIPELIPKPSAQHGHRRTTWTNNASLSDEKIRVGQHRTSLLRLRNQQVVGSKGGARRDEAASPGSPGPASTGGLLANAARPREKRSRRPDLSRCVRMGSAIIAKCPHYYRRDLRGPLQRSVQTGSR